MGEPPPLAHARPQRCRPHSRANVSVSADYRLAKYCVISFANDLNLSLVFSEAVSEISINGL